MRDLIHELLGHYGDLRRQLGNELKDPHYAADIAQSSFERVYAHVADIREKIRKGLLPDAPEAVVNAPRALLFRVAQNLCIDDARRRKVAQDWASAHAVVNGQAAAPSSESVAAQRQVLERLVAVLEKLPPRRREVFLLFRAQGYTRAEIARRLDITEVAVAKHLVRATLDCSHALAALQASLIEPQHLPDNAGMAPPLAEDFS